MVPYPNTATIKFVCSYGGKILPRYTDGKLRYHGGHNRVLSVNRSIPFSELMLKLAEMCGSPVILRCQLPTEDLDALVSITSDEDLANLIEEYDRVSAMAAEAAAPRPPPLKIRAFLYPPKSTARKAPVSPPSPSASTSEPSSSSSSLSSSSYSSGYSPRSAVPAKPPLPPSPPKMLAKVPYHGCYVYRNPSHIYLIQNGINHWQ